MILAEFWSRLMWLFDVQNQRDPRLNEILFPLFDDKRVKSIIDAYEVREDFSTAGQIRYR